VVIPASLLPPDTTHFLGQPIVFGATKRTLRANAAGPPKPSWCWSHEGKVSDSVTLPLRFLKAAAVDKKAVHLELGHFPVLDVEPASEGNKPPKETKFKLGAAVSGDGKSNERLPLDVQRAWVFSSTMMLKSVASAVAERDPLKLAHSGSRDEGTDFEF